MGLILAVGTVIRVPQLFHSLADGNASRQTQTALVVREYAAKGIDVFHTPLPVFGPGSDVPMEMPLAQAVAALIAELGVGSDVAMRLVGLTGFQTSALLLFLLVYRWHGSRTALIALTCFEFLPFGLAWGASSLIEFPAVALSLAMVLCLDRWFRQGGYGSLVIGAGCGWLAFLVKVTTAAPWSILVVASALTALLASGRDTRLMSRVVTGGLAGPGIGLALALWWTHYADGIKEQHPLTQPLTSKALSGWNFGTADQRLDLTSYTTLLERLNGNLVGSLALVGVVLAFTRGRDLRDRVLRLSWLVVALAAPLVFLNLYIAGPHTYYTCAIYAAGTVLVAFTLDALTQWLTGKTAKWAAYGLPIAVAWAIGALSVQGVQNLGQFVIDEPEPSWAAFIRDETEPDDKIVVIGCQWAPVLAYFTNRTMLMFDGADDHGYWAQADDAGDYPYLFTCDTALDPQEYLAPGTRLAPTNFYRLFHIESS